MEQEYDYIGRIKSVEYETELSTGRKNIVKIVMDSSYYLDCRWGSILLWDSTEISNPKNITTLELQHKMENNGTLDKVYKEALDGISKDKINTDSEIANEYDERKELLFKLNKEN